MTRLTFRALERDQQPDDPVWVPIIAKGDKASIAPPIGGIFKHEGIRYMVEALEWTIESEYTGCVVNLNVFVRMQTGENP